MVNSPDQSIPSSVQSHIGRMLLSHNFEIGAEVVPPLSAEEFCQALAAGCVLPTAPETIQCRQIAHPHWRMEIRFDLAAFSPTQIGERCAQALAAKRKAQQVNPADFPEILILGGLKTTPPTSDAPEALQPGEWGVDVVETASGTAFLEGMGWDAAVAERPAETIFKVEWLKESHV